MDLQFTIDPNLCIQCGACIDDCPFHIIEMSSDYPALNPSRVHHCIRCQHCLAVCPTGALSILGRNPEDSLPLPHTLPSADQVAALIRGRRSVRRYLPEPLEAEVIDHLLRTVANAPTGKNNRQCLFTVIEDQATMDIVRRETIEGLRRAVAEKSLPQASAISAMSSPPGTRAATSFSGMRPICSWYPCRLR
jgi:ferredoxin